MIPNGSGKIRGGGGQLNRQPRVKTRGYEDGKEVPAGSHVGCGSDGWLRSWSRDMGGSASVSAGVFHTVALKSDGTLVIGRGGGILVK